MLLWPSTELLVVFLIQLASITASSSLITKILTIKTCGEPKIENSMMNVTVKPGEMAQFKCQVDMSCLVAYIEWYHDMKNGSHTLIKTASSSGDPHVHTIREVSPLHEGLYTCQAGNVMGKAIASAYLSVNGAETLQKGLSGSFVFLLMLQILIWLTHPG